MRMRASMRPISLRRVIEVSNLALKCDEINKQTLSKVLGTTLRRAREMLLEMERMNLLTRRNDVLFANDNTKVFITYFENEDWNGFRTYFEGNYYFYRELITLLEASLHRDKGLTLEEAVSEAKEMKLSLNRTSLEVLFDWCERLNVIQRHLYAKRFYMIRKEAPRNELFETIFHQSYDSLNIERGLNLRLVYVEIPRLREEVCERLKLSREDFDVFFTRLCFESIGKIELSGAPTITSAKKSPFIIKKIRGVRKENIVAPFLDQSRERVGIDIGKKSYYYVAIHERL